MPVAPAQAAPPAPPTFSPRVVIGLLGMLLTSLAAAVITVVGVVFSITILALQLASTQFGPRMLRNFIRDRGTQVTLGIFVATFVYCLLTLGSIAPVGHRDFVPHLSITVTFALALANLLILIYFIHHVATSIQLNEVVAGIARDLHGAIQVQFPNDSTDRAAEYGPSPEELQARREAAEKAEKLRPDLVLLDLTMPEMNGLDAARRIRSLLPETPILILSVHKGKQLMEEARKIGVKGYVTKGEAVQKLVQAVDAVLQNEAYFPTDL